MILLKLQSKEGVATLIGGRHGMNAMKQVLMGLVLAGAVMVPHHGAAWGTGTLNVQFNTDMVSTGVDPNASGTIVGTLMRHGFSSSQQLKLSLAHLDPNTVYQLIAFIGDETNPQPVTDFTTDQNGAFAITYVQNCPRTSSPGGHPGDGDDSGEDHGNGKGKGKGKGRATAMTTPTRTSPLIPLHRQYRSRMRWTQSATSINWISSKPASSCW